MAPRDSCRCRRSSFASTPIRPPSSSTTAARCAGAPQSLRRTDGGAHARRILQVRRSLAQPVQRGAVGARRRLAGGDAVECRGRGRACCARRCAATTRRSSSSIARCSMALGRGAPIPATITWCRSARRALLRERRALTLVTWGAMVERCELALERTGIEADLLDLRTLSPWDHAGDARIGAQDPSLPDRARGHYHGGIRRGDRRRARQGGFLRSGCAHRAARHAGHSEPAQPGAARRRAAERRAHLPQPCAACWRSEHERVRSTSSLPRTRRAPKATVLALVQGRRRCGPQGRAAARARDRQGHRGNSVAGQRRARARS